MREDIREGLQKIELSGAIKTGHLYLGTYDIYKILSYLHSKGVVIMVDGNYDVAQVEPLIEEEE